MDSNYFTHTLPNGLRIVHQQVDSPVGYCGIAVNAGSRDESADKFGIAHFVEHTIFKGTKRRKSGHINNRMERVGGELNAYTAKEETMVYSIFPSMHYERAIELLGDLILNSIFPHNELEKEREVVLDEIDSYRDMPSEAIYDDYEDLIFLGNGLGHNILGTDETLKSMTSEDCRRFLDYLYVPSNMVFFSLGNIDFARLCRYVERHFGGMNHVENRIPRVIPEIKLPAQKHISIDAHQSHTIYGVPTFGMYDDRKYALALLNNILAGPGMNSLLNVALREKRGYVYTVESTSTLFTDNGVLTIYFGCDDYHVKPCLRLTSNIIDDLANHPLTAKRLDMAKQQYLGQLLVSIDSKDAWAISLGKSMLYFNRCSTVAEISEKINAITPQQVQDMAQMLVKDNATVLTMD